VQLCYTLNPLIQIKLRFIFLFYVCFPEIRCKLICGVTLQMHQLTAQSSIEEKARQVKKKKGPPACTVQTKNISKRFFDCSYHYYYTVRQKSVELIYNM